ncbi:histidine utilization repressor [Alteromonas mediterranea]|uniref:histidine utilization repressor n=1 Tax=Alteromonas mediterranea TaxID=314275 RepID=UPI00035559CA|nr:histidine utilization repressor [Alteromonas mediterranea]AGP88892.1 GntR family transcriptional regulator [Alteromonas mediterranea U7]AGP92997.1 GntR family transcriptional regulator [Alteromonas mediterranea U8]|tara:strand:- start:214 stop:924 length:711 start_codon:yes stop_codon:yes gene_type:complete
MPPVIEAPYLKLKKSILNKIISGEWEVGFKIPADKDLGKEAGVSRLTANKAMSELADEGYVQRAPGIGSFVADNRSHGQLLQVTNIAEEIRSKSHHYDNHIIKIGECNADSEVAKMLQITKGDNIYKSSLIHKDEGVPIQLEIRYVNPLVAPDFLNVNFSKTTPTAYLMSISPPQEVEQKIEAVMPSETEKNHLELRENEPCLLISRRTWIRGAVATFVRLYHPGSRFDLSGRWTP